MTTEQIATQDPFAPKVDAIIVRARAITIIDQPTYNAATELGLGVKKLRKEIKEHHDPIIKAARATVDAARAAFTKLDAPLEQAEGIIKGEITKFTIEQQRIERERQIEAQRLAKQQQEDALLQIAQQAKDSGATDEQVDKMLDSATQLIPTPVVKVAPVIETAKGVSKPVTRYSAEVFDLRLLVEAWLKGDPRVPPDCIIANLPPLNKLASAMETSFSLPGVRAVPDVNVRFRA